MTKLLKDFPLDAWMDAADCCEYCDAKTAVKVVFVDDSGTFGGKRGKRTKTDVR